MANEFKHKNAGSELTSVEFHATDLHEADSQIANDMLYYNGTTWVRATSATIRGLLEHSITFHVNAFQYPAPGTDWTPQLTGAYLPASKATKKVWLPLNFLKVGDIITAYNLVGDATEATALTLDCKLVQVNKADPLTTTDITNGAMAQVNSDGNFDVAVNPDDTTVATDKQYLLEILGTTGGGDSITVMGAEIAITRKI